MPFGAFCALDEGTMRMHGHFKSAHKPIGALMLACATALTARAETTAAPDRLEEIQVTAERLGLMGSATTASEGIIVNDELALTPAFRVGQLVGTVPGLP